MTTTQIEYLGVQIVCTGNYELFKQGQMYDVDGLGQPDYPATFEILKIETEEGSDITDLIRHERDLETIELLCLDNLE